MITRASCERKKPGEKNMVQCMDCGKTVDDPSDLHHTFDMGEVCDICFEYYWECNNCNAYFSEIDHVVQEYENGYFISRFVCERCFILGNYTECTDCNRFYQTRRIEIHDGRAICVDCVHSNYFICSACDLFLDIDRMVFPGICLCQECVEPENERHVSTVRRETSRAPESSRNMAPITFKHDMEIDKILADPDSEM